MQIKNTHHTLTRRKTLTALALVIPAWNETLEAAENLVCVPATPTVTEGPYWVDEKLFRSDIRTDPATGVARDGIQLTLTITVQNVGSGGCAPLAGAYVDIWHCDAKGIYSDEGTYNPGGGTGAVNTSGQKFLRGYQVTGDDGQVQFTTIYPGWYGGRTIHIHMRVRTYSGTTVLSNFVTQLFFDDAVSDTVMAASAYSRSTRRDTTNATDGIYRVANAERMLLTLGGDATTGFTGAITVGAAFQTAAAASPAITPDGVRNAFSGGSGVAPGAWISIYGANLASSSRTLAASDIVGSMLPTSLGGVGVQVDGRPAYIQYVSPAQINVLAPADASAGPVAVTVTNAAGTSNAVTTMSQPFLPGLAVAANYVRAVRYPDGTIINGTGAAEPGYTSAAAIGPGDIISLFGTGFGPADSPLAPGAVFTEAYATTNRVTVTIGGIDATVLWAGLVGPGLYQINVIVPPALADGDHSVVSSVAGAGSPSGALLKVAAAAKLTGSLKATPQRRVPPVDLRPDLPPALDFRRRLGNTYIL